MGAVTYQLALPPSLSSVHEVFHVSILRKYVPDPTHIVDWGELVVDTDGTFEEGPVHLTSCGTLVILITSIGEFILYFTVNFYFIFISYIKRKKKSCCRIVLCCLVLPVFAA